jgi:alginate O-acetyltransferase complex protein AlgI
MVFSGYSFLFVFLPAVLFVYYVLLRRRESRNVFLLLASLAFYAYGEPTFVLLLIASIAGNWLFALGIDRFRARAGTILVLALGFNLAILFTFKYLTFTLRTFNALFGTDLPIPRILLPIGISFFTFQAISYVTDVYRSVKSGAPFSLAQKNPLRVGLYIALFPQLVAGPIVRYSMFADQILGRKETFARFSEGVSRFIFGLAKKVLLANNLALVADYAFGTDRLTVAAAWMGALAYTLQIYFDFSGYSDMAVGLGKMFGFTLPENFDYPYIARSASEFWRRWHISLGAWFRDYVYVPLGGSRVSSKVRLLFNLFVVWGLTGLWHGANLTFVVWGLMYFVLTALEKLTGFEKRLGPAAHLYLLFFVVLGWVFFRSNDLSHGVAFARTMFGLAGVPLWDPAAVFWFREHAVFFVFGLLFSLPVLPRFRESLGAMSGTAFFSATVRGVLLLLSVAYLLGNSYAPFIYFNF